MFIAPASIVELLSDKGVQKDDWTNIVYKEIETGKFEFWSTFFGFFLNKRDDDASLSSSSMEIDEFSKFCNNQFLPNEFPNW